MNKTAFCENDLDIPGAIKFYFYYTINGLFPPSI